MSSNKNNNSQATKSSLITINPAYVFNLHRLAIEPLGKTALNLAQLQKILKKIYFTYQKNVQSNATLPCVKMVMGPQGMGFSSPSAQFEINVPNSLPVLEKIYSSDQIINRFVIKFNSILTDKKNKKFKAAFCPIVGLNENIPGAEKERRDKGLYFNLETKELFINDRTHACLFICIYKSSNTSYKNMDLVMFNCICQDQAYDILKVINGDTIEVLNSFNKINTQITNQCEDVNSNLQQNMQTTPNLQVVKPFNVNYSENRTNFNANEQYNYYNNQMQPYAPGQLIAQNILFDNLNSAVANTHIRQEFTNVPNNNHLYNMPNQLHVINPQNFNQLLPGQNQNMPGFSHYISPINNPSIQGLNQKYIPYNDFPMKSNSNIGQNLNQMYLNYNIKNVNTAGFPVYNVEPSNNNFMIGLNNQSQNFQQFPHIGLQENFQKSLMQQENNQIIPSEEANDNSNTQIIQKEYKNASNNIPSQNIIQTIYSSSNINNNNSIDLPEHTPKVPLMNQTHYSNNNYNNMNNINLCGISSPNQQLYEQIGGVTQLNSNNYNFDNVIQFPRPTIAYNMSNNQENSNQPVQPVVFPKNNQQVNQNYTQNQISKNQENNNLRGSSNFVQDQDQIKIVTSVQNEFNNEQAKKAQIPQFQNSNVEMTAYNVQEKKQNEQQNLNVTQIQNQAVFINTVNNNETIVKSQQSNLVHKPSSIQKQAPVPPVKPKKDIVQSSSSIPLNNQDHIQILQNHQQNIGNSFDTAVNNVANFNNNDRFNSNDSNLNASLVQPETFLVPNTSDEEKLVRPKKITGIRVMPFNIGESILKTNSNANKAENDSSRESKLIVLSPTAQNFVIDPAISKQFPYLNKEYSSQNIKQSNNFQNQYQQSTSVSVPHVNVENLNHEVFDVVKQNSKDNSRPDSRIFSDQNNLLKSDITSMNNDKTKKEEKGIQRNMDIIDSLGYMP